VSGDEATDNDGRYRHHYYLTPTEGAEVTFKEPSVGELARVIKAGACIEASFKRGKGEVGMDEYQVRTWQGWHHHMTLSAAGGVVLDRRDAPRSAVDASVDPAASAIRAEPALAGGLLHAGRGLYLPPSAATITAQ